LMKAIKRKAKSKVKQPEPDKAVAAAKKKRRVSFNSKVYVRPIEKVDIHHNNFAGEESSSDEDEEALFESDEEEIDGQGVPFVDDSEEEEEEEDEESAGGVDLGDAEEEDDEEEDEDEVDEDEEEDGNGGEKSLGVDMDQDEVEDDDDEEEEEDDKPQASARPKAKFSIAVGGRKGISAAHAGDDEDDEVEDDDEVDDDEVDDDEMDDDEMDDDEMEEDAAADSEDTDLEDGDEEQEGAPTKSGFNNIFNNILERKLKSDQGPMLAQRPTLVKKLDEETQAEKEKAIERQVRKELLMRDHMVPLAFDPVHEKTLLKIATRGVVKFFSAVAQQNQAAAKNLPSTKIRATDDDDAGEDAEDGDEAEEPTEKKVVSKAGLMDAMKGKAKEKGEQATNKGADWMDDDYAIKQGGGAGWDEAESDFED